MSGNQKHQQSKNKPQLVAKNKKPVKKAAQSTYPEQILSAPETLRSEDILSAQQQVGNQVVQRALDDHVRGKKGLTDSQGNLREDLNDQIQKKRGGGSPLPDSIQKDASRKLGRSFKDVRIHTDDSADKLSRKISARAFTIGSDIFFKGGVFSPGSSAGRETLIHELTHVVQQTAGGKKSGGKLKLGAPDTALEKEAAHMGKKHASQTSVSASIVGAVQRDAVPEEEMMLQLDSNAFIQREGEEDEIQLQQDHHGSAAGMIVQRDLDDELKAEVAKRKLKRSQVPDAPALPTTPIIAPGDPAQKLKAEITKRKKYNADIKAGKVPDAPALPPAPVAAQAGPKLPVFGPKRTEAAYRKSPKYADLATARKKMGIGKKKNLGNIKAIDKEQGKRLDQNTFAPIKKDAEKKKESSRQALMNTIKDPRSSSEDVAAAKEQLDMVHKRSKSDKFKSIFKKGQSSKDYSAIAMAGRKKALPTHIKNLEIKAGQGDKAALEELKAAKAERGPTKTQKVGGAIKSGFGSLKSMVGGQFSSLKEHYLGASKKKEAPKEEAKAEAKSESGGGGSIEKIIELAQKNQKLETENAELNKKLEEAEKSKVGSNG